ncbi:transcriptional regulator family: Zinc finger, GRF-type [Paecilomyces variotii]|nr:transcriptional regulator family: Zinc finger, GRF-type [Paecilomyces variotii]
MFRNRGSITPRSPRVVAPLRGRFIEGEWHCNCEPRLFAAHFQTKNQGPNHGRWFYTCQKPQGERCNFFLWDDDAKVREDKLSLSHSVSEPDQTPGTPSKTVNKSGGLLTPASAWRRHDTPRTNLGTPSKVRKSRDISDDEYFSWDEGLDDEVQGMLDRPAQPKFSPETPRKTPRTALFTSPGKRKLSETANASSNTYSDPFTSSAQDTHLATPQSQAPSQLGSVPPSSMEISATPTPSKYTNVLSTDNNPDVSELATTALAILDSHDVVMPRKAKEALVELLNRHDLRTRGIIRGREISRLALKKKDEQIKQLNERISGLEAEREMNRSAVAGLKQQPE